MAAPMPVARCKEATGSGVFPFFFYFSMSVEVAFFSLASGPVSNATLSFFFKKTERRHF
jgi:hypothetical protein